VGWALAKLLAAVALIGLASHLLVASTRLLATALHVAAGWNHADTTGLLSVVVIAAATSAPDAFTSLAAARRGEGSMAVANAVGSNTFDILVCLGLPAAVMGGRPVSALVRVTGGFLLMSAVLVLGLGLRQPVLKRRHGLQLLGLYLTFLLLVAGFFWLRS
jgi:Ca2+/Na+ antiporter